ncbi:unnamed protein product [Protopolystoma xenopodis]|uniref:Uncharacterized protein n=1 Tax=Protopolystoma xenopodis TaxID=117903 RepID=A0A3S5CN03_9PLAT|nr:unnamed protein product [Protopolystoma xenopodis]
MMREVAAELFSSSPLADYSKTSVASASVSPISPTANGLFAHSHKHMCTHIFTYRECPLMATLKMSVFATGFMFRSGSMAEQVDCGSGSWPLSPRALTKMADVEAFINGPECCEIRAPARP